MHAFQITRYFNTPTAYLKVLRMLQRTRISLSSIELTVADTMKDYKPPLANIKHLFLNIRDLPQTQLHDYFLDAFSFIDECAADGGKVLVHCVAGKSRSASIVIPYMMKTLKMSFYSTFRLVKEKRPGIGPNHGFISQLKKFDEELHKDEF